MKIDGMDATSMQSIRTQSNDHNIDVKETSAHETNVHEENAQLKGKNEEYVSEKAVLEAIEKANKAITVTRTQMEFSIHEKTKEIMVKVINTDTKEIIREIPPEKVLDMVAKMWEMAGILVDERR